jgi:hypothetical protein
MLAKDHLAFDALPDVVEIFTADKRKSVVTWSN